MPGVPTYNLKYQIEWSNENNEFCRLNLSSLTDNGDLVKLKAAEDALSISFPSSEEDKFSPIRGSELTARMLIYDSDGVNLSTFLGSDNEWKVDYFKGEDLVIPYWQGYLTQEEHSRELQDEPWLLELHAFDGLGLLKDKPLIKADGTNFDQLNFILDYVGDTLWLVNPFLRLVTHVNIFHIAMDDRDIAAENDPWLQTKVDARRFKSDPKTFDDAYSALEKILISWGCELFQWQGAWHIMDLWDWMKGQTSYTVYKYDLVSPTDAHIRIVDSGHINETFEAKIAPHNNTIYSGPIEPEEEDQTLGLKFANKEVKLTYRYEVPPNLINNEKLQDLGSFLAPLSGTGYSAWNLVGWGRFNGTMTAEVAETTANGYIKTEFDAFATETDRYYVIEGRTGVDTYLRNLNTDFYVQAGDKIAVNATQRYNSDLAGGVTNYLSQVLIYKGGTVSTPTNWYSLDENGFWQNNDTTFWFKRGISAPPLSQWISFSIEESEPIPVDGIMYLVLSAKDTDTGFNSQYKDSYITYYPYLRGSRFFVKGDYNLIAQNTDYKQKDSRDIYLSDSPKRILKGAMWRYSNIDGWVLTSPNWYRYGITETRRFGEIQALKRFWHTYRAMQKIEGSFNGLFFFGDTVLPFGLIPTLYPEYLGDGKRYMLTSLEENHKTATWKGTMIEVGSTDDAAITIDTNRFDYLFE